MTVNSDAVRKLVNGGGAILILFFASSVHAAERQKLRGQVPAVLAHLQPLERLASTERLDLALGLPLRNRETLTNFLRDLYDPASPQYRRYLTAGQFAERFGPTEKDYQAVIAFAQANGLVVAGTCANRTLLEVNASVADIEAAFHLKLHLYPHPKEARTFRAPEVEPSLDLEVPLLTISGLDDYVRPRPMDLKMVPLNEAAGANPLVTGSGPRGYFLGRDFRAAYVPGVSLDGSGQAVGLFSLDGYNPSDIAAYENLAGLPHVPLRNFLLRNYSGVAGPNNLEVALDIEMAISMAPGLAEVIVYEGRLRSQADVITPIFVLNCMATNNEARQLSSSWSFPVNASTMQIYQQFAAQGQSMFQASGDFGAWMAPALPPLPPTDIPMATIVGGTALTTSGPGGPWLSETTWSGSGGGWSTNWPIQTWQQGTDMSTNGGSTTMRNFPDVAAVADPSIWCIANRGEQGIVGGTSAAAPLWAGLAALANQQAAAEGRPSIGFINPALYAIGQRPVYAGAFHDIATGNNTNAFSPDGFFALPGYDLATGWGTPTGSNLIRALIAPPDALQITPETAVVASGPVAGPFSPALQTYALTNFGLSPLDWKLVNAPAWLSASPTNGTLLPGGPEATVALSLNPLAGDLPAGSYTATVWFTNLSDFVCTNLGCTNLNGQVGQSRRFTLAVVSTPAILGPPTDQVVLPGATATFTVVTSSNALLFYEWRKDNGMSLTNLVDGGHVSGSATAALTISNVSLGDVGAYSVAVSNAAGEAVSPSAFLAIVPWRPVITAQPASQTVLPAATASFTVAAVGSEPLSYRWQKAGTNLTDGGNVSGSASATLSLSNVSAASAGTYSVLVSNALGSAASTGAALVVVPLTVPEVALATLFSFSGGTDGGTPNGLVQGASGDLYGTTQAGGTNSAGTVFEMPANGTPAGLYSFSGGSDGAAPWAALVQGPEGSLYGTTSAGGAHGNGTVFRLDPTGVQTTMVSFDAANGAYPVDALAPGTDGDFYGTTYTGGASGYGTVFRLTPEGTLTTLHSLDGLAEGAFPYSGLMQGHDGYFYGTTYKGGGLGGNGTVFRMSAAGTLTALVSFNSTNGGYPFAGLVQGTDGDLYGTTTAGSAGNGTVFKVTPTGAVTTLHSFSYFSDGAFPHAGLLQASDGNLYGATAYGGTNNAGTIFRIAPDGPLVTLAWFDGYNGANPQAALIEGADGNLYGTTAAGGTGNQGTIFRLTINSAPQITSQPASQTVFSGTNVMFSVAVFGSPKLSYRWQKNGTNLTDAGNLSGSASRVLLLTNVTPADAGRYSVSVSNALGSLMSSNAVLQVADSPPLLTSQPANATLPPGGTATFTVTAIGSQPLSYQWQGQGTNLTDGGDVSGSTSETLRLSHVIEANDGTYTVIVTNRFGRTNSAGAQLAVIPPSAPCTRLATVAAFTGTSNGTNLNGLVQSADGSFYGTAESGGASNLGTIFRMSTDGSVTRVVSFAGANGANPQAALTLASDGSFYGTTCNGGLSGLGSVFKLAGDGTLTNLAAFNYTNGANPRAALVQGQDGDFYGTTTNGGLGGKGTVFRVTSGGALVALVSFTGANGANPYGGLLQAADGNFYGTTYRGGAKDCGTVFKMTPTGALTTLYSFTTNGAGAIPIPVFPAGTLVQGTDGDLYGTTEFAFLQATWFIGAVFRITTNGALTTLYAFNGFTSPMDGFYPRAGLVQGADGNFYGTCYGGGAFFSGTVFRITPAGAHTMLSAFDDFNDGAHPQAALALGFDGNFYGTTAIGGWGGQGTIFRLTIAPQITAQPASQTNFTGAAATLNVGALGGWPLSYQWRRNGTNLADSGSISGAASAVLTLSNLAPTDAGAYSVIVSNSLFTDPGCSRASAVATLTVTSSPPLIIAQPASQTVPPGATATFTVGAIGSQPLAYQWRFDGADLAGATSSRLTLPGVQPAQAGNYAVCASNSLGTATSAAAGLAVLPVLGWTRGAQGLVLTWISPYVLQSATNVPGPYFDVPGATSPYLVVPTGPQRFFRLRAVMAGTVSSGSFSAGGQFQLNATGLPGYSYLIQASTNLTDWVSLQTNPVPFQFVDADAAQYPSRFYRTVLAP